MLAKIKRILASWAIYDWGMSAFSTVVTTFIFAAYFTRKIAPNEIIGTRDWGYAIALAGIIIVLLSPLCGAIADSRGKRKPWLALFTLFVIIGAALLWFAKPHPNYIHIALFAVIVGTIGIEISQVFYNALLPLIAPPNYLGRISGWGWGTGYAGGLTALITCLVFFVNSPPAALADNFAYVRICGPLVAVWIVIFSLPLFLFVPDYPANKPNAQAAIIVGLKELWQTLKTLPKQRNVFLYLIARMFYLDGLNTVFAFAGIYAAGTFGMSIAQVIKLGIATNITAGLGAALFAWLDDYIGAKTTILIALCALLILGTSIVLVTSVTLFWVLAVTLSLFFGPVQAASRSFLARLVPKEKITEMFGLYALSGKVTAFLGPWLVGSVTLYYQSQRAGIASVLSLFVIGAFLLTFVKSPSRRHPAA